MTDDPAAGKIPTGVTGLAVLAPERLIHACDCSSLSFSETTELKPQDKPLGQDRALEAIEFGVWNGGHRRFPPKPGQRHMVALIRFTYNRDTGIS